jgi:hypothetical protein
MSMKVVVMAARRCGGVELYLKSLELLVLVDYMGAMG